MLYDRLGSYECTERRGKQQGTKIETWCYIGFKKRKQNVVDKHDFTGFPSSLEQSIKGNARAKVSRSSQRPEGWKHALVLKKHSHTS